MTKDTVQVESLFARLIGVLVVGFGVYFLVTEWGGLWVFVRWLGQHLAQTPQTLQALVTYYGALPAAQWIPSVLIGALFGGVTSVAVMRSIRAGVVGVVAGVFGAQLLTRLLQHCTYLPEASRLEFWWGTVITCLSSLIVLLPLWAFWRQRTQVQLESSAGYFRARWLPYVLLSPMIFNLLLFLYYPSLQTIILSLNSRRFPLPQERFVCLGNYIALSTDIIYGNSLFVTALLTVCIVALSLILALGTALLASQQVYAANLYRTLLIWPFALSPVVAGAIFLVIFREGENGLINAVLHALNGTTLNWQREPALAQISIVAASVWNILGFNILFYIAGLQNVPTDLLQAAEIDGANRLQRFFSITLPLLAPYTFFLLVTNVTYAFYGIYGVVDTITQGGPPLGAAGQAGGATDVLIFKLYEDAFNPGSPAGLAAAQAVILFLLLAGITLLQFRTIESRITYGE